MSQIKSRKRVMEYGEVFTSDKLVSEMLSLVDNELYRIDSKFLEPACGTGNFLEPVLRTKLDQVKKKYKKIIREYEQQSLLALGSLYGIELLQDNIAECRERIFLIWHEEYKTLYKRKVNADVIESARFIVKRNIVCGDALRMVDLFGKPIVFSEWSIVTPGKMQRKDFCYNRENDDIGELNILLSQYVTDYRRLWINGD